MAIATRAKHGLTRRHLLVRSASSIALAGLGSLAGPHLSRAADRPRLPCGIASGDVSSDSAVVWARADRPARMRVECSTVESFKSIIRVASSDALPDHDFTSKVLLDGLPPGQDIFYRVQFEDIGEPRFQAKPRSDISGPRRQTRVRYRDPRSHLSGRAIPRARAGASIPLAAACEPTRPCSKAARTFLSIAAITSTPTVRSLRN
jgi:PhoD-like phosphatase, N-terminal domain